MTRIDAPLNDPRPRYRGTGFNLRPGGLTLVADKRSRWGHIRAWLYRQGIEWVGCE